MSCMGIQDFFVGNWTPFLRPFIVRLSMLRLSEKKDVSKLTQPSGGHKQTSAQLVLTLFCGLWSAPPWTQKSLILRHQLHSANQNKREILLWTLSCYFHSTILLDSSSLLKSRHLSLEDMSFVISSQYFPKFQGDPGEDKHLPTRQILAFIKGEKKMSPLVLPFCSHNGSKPCAPSEFPSAKCRVLSGHPAKPIHSFEIITNLH